MTEQAKAQEADQQIEFAIMDAAYPQLPSNQYDLILCRHILWSLPQPEDIIQRWATLLSPGGRFFWSKGTGIQAQGCIRKKLWMLSKSIGNVTVINLSGQPQLWGGMVSDERYLVFASSVEDSGRKDR